MEQLHVKRPTLRYAEQLIAYRPLYRTATSARLIKYCKLHCARLDEARCCVVQLRLEHRKDSKRKLQALAASLCGQTFDPSEITQLKLRHWSDVYGRLHTQYKIRASERAFARGLEQLVEECEALLQQKGQKFTAIDWRPFTSRKRWRDGKRWTGLREEEVRTDTVEVSGRDVSSTKVPIDVRKAVYRAQFARYFPRTADKRYCAADVEAKI